MPPLLLLKQQILLTLPIFRHDKHAKQFTLAKQLMKSLSTICTLGIGGFISTKIYSWLDCFHSYMKVGKCICITQMPTGNDITKRKQGILKIVLD